MRKTTIATLLAAFAFGMHPAYSGEALPLTDSGSPDFRAVERLLQDNTEDARRRLIEAIRPMDAHARKGAPAAAELVTLGRAYLKAMGQAGAYRAGELAAKALSADPKLGSAHLLLAELAAYSGCTSCAEESLRNARELGVAPASIAALEGLAFWMQAASDSKNRAVGEKPPLERAMEAYGRAVALESDPKRIVALRTSLFELERMAGNHAKALEQGEAVLASGEAADDFAARYASFLLYEHDDIERAAGLAAHAAAVSSAPEATDVFAMVLFRLWADAYAQDPAHPHTRIKLEAAKGASRDVSGVFARSLASTATLPVAKALLSAKLVKPSDPSMRDASGNTPLANAVAGARADFARGTGNGPYAEPLNDEQFELVKMLLQQGANPNAFVTGWNQTVLGHAASRGDVRTVKLLLDHGANVHAVMTEGSSVIAEAAEAVRQREADEIVGMFLARGVPVSLPNKRGETALHAAARNGNTVLVQRLLKAGADPMARDNSGWRPLEVATSYGHTDAVKALLGAGAQVAPVVNACGTSNAVEIASRMQNRQLLELLRPHLKQGI
jgi:ankyrin repeat protein